jgi:predicted metalloprotease with PDZ domain
MVHLALPSLPDQHHWLEEGLATYVEPIARARAGILTPEQAWTDLVYGLPQGQPEAGDRGLDRTPTWGRTYWGGALFCLRADVAIRQRTGNRRGLEHALRAILAAGGSIDRDWNIDQVIEIGDQAVGVSVLRELYDEMGSKPVTVDLRSLWRELGIQRHGKTVIFDDSAPLANVRSAITASNEIEITRQIR